MRLSKTSSSALEAIASEGFDLVVAGATPAGIVCAIRAAREGLRVLLTHHGIHLGGFMTSGAGGWEAPYDGARSPLYDETLRRISEHYRSVYGEDSPQHRASRPDPTTRSRLGRPKVEPHVAELIFEQMLAEESHLSLLRGFYPVSATREEKRLMSVTFQEMNGSRCLTVTGANFSDCTYEGDLAAVAGVSWRVGREARTEYQEPHAGVIFTRDRQVGKSPHPRPPMNIRQMGSSDGVDILEPESTGEADDSVMAYNYRLILTKDPDNRVIVAKPEGYDPEALGWAGRSIVPNLQNGKIAWNGAGRLIGPQHEYPKGDWDKRESISRQYLNAALGRLWFYQNDPGASEEDREFWRDYGLARDEFADNGHVPYEVYVREARRIMGRYVFTEHDAVFVPGMERTPIQPDSIAVTDWPIDSVVCTDALGRQREGAFIIADAWRPVQVPYRILLPQELDNLLVPVCLSASHVGFGTLRLEPVWMQVAEAAGYAIALAHKCQCPPSEVDTDELLRVLVNARCLVSFFNDIDVAADGDLPAAVQYLGTKGFFNTYDARPDAPLSPVVAEVWLRIVRALLAGDRDFSPTTFALELPDCSAESKEAVSRGYFSAQLQELVGNAENVSRVAGGDADSSLKRGEACLMIFNMLCARVESNPTVPA
jgi:hypothetical protein